MSNQNNIEDLLSEWAEATSINDGHEHRFGEKLKHLNQQKRKVLFQRVVWAAALFTGIIIAVWWGTNTSVMYVESKIELPTEVGKVEKFFSQQVSELNLDLQNENDALLNQFLRELARLEGEYEKLNGLYQKQPNNANLIDGMIENFEYRLKIMQQIKSYLEIKQLQNGHENKLV